MALNSNALIDLDYYEIMSQETDYDEDYIENLINTVSTGFEKFCNRYLKERTYTYVEDDEDLTANIYYVPHYTVFDAPFNSVFWFPTYPISNIDYFEISGNEVEESTTYVADVGYKIYKRTGKLVYLYGFDYPYLQNVKIVWTGGYSESSLDMSHLKYLCFVVIKDILNSPQNSTFKSEKIGMYSYETMPTYFLKSLEGLSPKVFSDLSKYRREAIG